MDIKKILFRTNSIDVEKALPDALILCGKDGKIQWVNDVAAEIFETSKMHLLTSNISDFIENPMNLISSSVIMHKPVITKFVDKEIYFDMTVKEIAEGYVLDFRDAVQNSAIAQDDKTEEINREKNNFLLKLANDLKSPIQSIVGFSQAMADGLGGEMSEQQEKYIRIINKNSSELMYFVGKLLELSQTESALKEPDKKTLDVLALVNSVVRFNEQLYKGKEVKISIKPEEDFKKTISTDEEILKNILQDVLEIILKSVDMGEVAITLSNPNDEFISSKNLAPAQYTMISLSTSALLLSENDLECMFDPYTILDSTNRKNVLRAIVLASVKNLVQSLNGIVWVESQILKNTSFNIIIPSN
ncbi:sensor histidine kinase [bacterium]|nr:sensor histidine kinase [bacterium]